MKMPLPPVYGRVFGIVVMSSVGLFGLLMLYLRVTGSSYPNVLTGQTEELPLVSSRGGIRYGTIYVTVVQLWLCYVLMAPVVLGVLLIPVGAFLKMRDRLKGSR